jgi:E3 ubiquitin-protein ligase RGLG
LESSNLIIGIDYTASNQHQGRKTFGGKCLHHIRQDQWNPYQKAIKMIGQTLEKFDDDKMIPVFGFGDALTQDFEVFPFLPDPNNSRYCHGFEEVLSVYERITPGVRLSGPTNFAPLIRKSIQTLFTNNELSAYHILVIIADGQVVNEKDTQDAIVQASKFPLSIIMVGVGDGPWGMYNNHYTNM